MQKTMIFAHISDHPRDSHLRSAGGSNPRRGASHHLYDIWTITSHQKHIFYTEHWAETSTRLRQLNNCQMNISLDASWAEISRDSRSAPPGSLWCEAPFLLVYDPRLAARGLPSFHAHVHAHAHAHAWCEAPFLLVEITRRVFSSMSNSAARAISLQFGACNRMAWTLVFPKLLKIHVFVWNGNMLPG